jgi:hypothetical protein
MYIEKKEAMEYNESSVSLRWHKVALWHDGDAPDSPTQMMSPGTFLLLLALAWCYQIAAHTRILSNQFLMTISVLSGWVVLGFRNF